MLMQQIKRKKQSKYTFKTIRMNEKNHHQLQDAPDVSLATQALVHTCFLTYKKMDKCFCCQTDV